MPGEIRLQGVRKAVAAHMTQSLAEAAQLSFHTDCDVTELLAIREAWKQSGRRISLEDCLIAGLADAMAAHPELNGRVVGDTFSWQETVNVAVAMSVGGMLLAPVIRDAAALGLDEIALRRRDLSERARLGTLKTSEMVGGTVTLSNLGLTAVRYFTPILNRGQLVILGLGRIEDRLAIGADGGVERRRMLGLSLTVDHRFVDGEPAGRLLGAICDGIVGVAQRP